MRPKILSSYKPDCAACYCAIAGGSRAIIPAREPVIAMHFLLILQLEIQEEHVDAALQPL
ncbi:MAG TPA: hypothetical protein VHZ51_06025 [Ktedonobacteraceae bacterium]|nr:hypothetical protein [Ktedonobacteraceae bacterium]